VSAAASRCCGVRERERERERESVSEEGVEGGGDPEMGSRR
jgi:hypothetical protein